MKQSNIVIFNPDMQRWDSMGHMGNPAANTPFLDNWILEDAVSFSHSYAQNPFCTPSRCSFMTGLYPHTRGHRTLNYMLHKDEPMLLDILMKNGYQTYWCGKNDLIAGQDGWWNRTSVYEEASEAKAIWGDFGKRRGGEGTDDYYSFYIGKIDKGQEDFYYDHDWCRVMNAIKYIENYDGSKPFCLYLPITYPHCPYAVEEPFYSSIDRNKLPERCKTPKSHPSLLQGIREKQKLDNYSEERWDELRATYLGMCARVDYQLKLVVDALKKKGLYDDTTIFYFSDHGDFVGDYGLVEKTPNTFEDVLVRVPLVVKPASTYKVKPGIRDNVVELIDFFATALDVANVDCPYPHYGKSLLPMVSGAKDSIRPYAYAYGGRLVGEEVAKEPLPVSSPYYPKAGTYADDNIPAHSKAAMLTDGKFKYVHRLEEEDELYDMVKDPDQINNLINHSEYNAKILEFKEYMLDLIMKSADFIPLVPDARRLRTTKDEWTFQNKTWPAIKD